MSALVGITSERYFFDDVAMKGAVVVNPISIAQGLETVH
jgi:hypothetical protein